MQGAVHSLHLNTHPRSPYSSPFASYEHLRSIPDDEMQEVQPPPSHPQMPTTASANFKSHPSATDPNSLNCYAVTDVYCCPIVVPQGCNSNDATMDTLAFEEPEVVEESQGAVGDAYRFRYSRVSPEEAYSPIAGVSPFRRKGRRACDDIKHVWVSHEDSDGAICSKPIHGPLSIIVRASDGSDQTFQVVDGMCVKNLKEKIWNLTGISPKSQCLVMANGAVAEDSMLFAGSGMQQFDVLYLKSF